MLAIAFVVLLVLFLSKGGEESLPERLAGFTTPVEADLQEDLVRRFRPLLFLDSAESWRPIEIGAFLAEAEADPTRDHSLCASPSDCKGLESVETFDGLIGSDPALGEGLYIDIAGGLPNGTEHRSPDSDCERSAPAVDCESGASSAIYYNVSSDRGRFYIDYWWFLRYNDFRRLGSLAKCERDLPANLTKRLCFDHEGDWEGVTVVVPIENPAAPEYVSYASHEGTFRYAAERLELEGTRPRVYLADGSHAAYPNACLGDCNQTTRILTIALPEGGYDGRRPWGNNSDTACLDGPESCLRQLPGPGESWNGFRGRWGELCSGGPGQGCPVARGPLSPAAQARFRDPWCSRTVKVTQGKDGRSERAEEEVTCDSPIASEQLEALAGRASDADCAAWSGQLAVLVACDRETLARGLATEPGRELPSPRVEIDGTAVGEVDIAGVAQVTRDEPLRPGQRIVVTGAVTDIIVKAAANQEVREARFGPGELTGERAVITIEALEGVPVISLQEPGEEAVAPKEELVRPVDE